MLYYLVNIWIHSFFLCVLIIQNLIIYKHKLNNNEHQTVSKITY